MIAQLTGVVAQVGPTSAVIEIGGLGIQAVCSPNTVAGLRLGQSATPRDLARCAGRLPHALRLRLDR
jgi:hypothetical protein